MKNYGIFRNLIYFMKESFTFNLNGVLISYLIIPAKILVALTTIYIPKIIIDTIQNSEDINGFIVVVGGITIVLIITSVLELYSKNTMEYCMNTFVLSHLNAKWVEKASSMEYSVFTSEEGKQNTEKARMALEGTTRWGIGTYFPRMIELITNILGFVTYSVILATLHPLVIVALIVSYLISLYFTVSVERKKQAKKDEIARIDRKLNYFAYKTKGLQIGKDIRLYAMREWIYEMTSYIKDDKRSIDKTIANYQLKVLSVNAILVFLRDGIAFSFLVYMAVENQVSVGYFALYSAAIIGLGDWLVGLTKNIGEFIESNNYVTDFRKYIDLPDKLFDSKRSLSIEKGDQFLIELNNLSYQYENTNNKVIDTINLTIKPGEKIAVVGENGAGKTTLIKLICGLLHATKGEVKLNGININEYKKEDFSAVFQDSDVLPISIKNNIKMNRDSYNNIEKINDSIKKAGLAKKINSLPEGVETQLIKHISENGTELSGGEKQKLLLARALYREAPVLILDEPTAAMDPIAEQDIYLKYNEYTKGKTAIFISHRLSSTRFCERIILISDGKIKEIGTHDELILKNGDYAKMFSMQSRYYRDGIEVD
ncbi:MAG: ABC transporter ATP-binding protein [Clostridiales bacterium]